MGFIKRWDVAEIKQQLNRCAGEMKYSKNDGFTQWYCKKDLMEIQYHLNDLLENSPNFGDLEITFKDDKVKEKTWNILNEKTN